MLNLKQKLINVSVYKLMYNYNTVPWLITSKDKTGTLVYLLGIT